MKIHKIHSSRQDADDRQRLVARLAELIVEMKEIAQELEQEQGKDSELPLAVFASLQELATKAKKPFPVMLAVVLALLLL